MSDLIIFITTNAFSVFIINFFGILFLLKIFIIILNGGYIKGRDENFLLCIVGLFLFVLAIDFINIVFLGNFYSILFGIILAIVIYIFFGR